MSQARYYKMKEYFTDHIRHDSETVDAGGGSVSNPRSRSPMRNNNTFKSTLTLEHGQQAPQKFED